MNQYDVNMLDAAVHDGSHWMGCILCPSLDGDNSGDGEASYNLLLTRKKAQFWKTKMLKKDILSRKSMEGIPIPTSVQAVAPCRVEPCLKKVSKSRRFQPYPTTQTDTNRLDWKVMGKKKDVCERDERNTLLSFLASFLLVIIGYTNAQSLI